MKAVNIDRRKKSTFSMTSPSYELSLAAAAEALGISEATTRNWIKNGALTACQKRGRPVVLQREVEMFHTRLQSEQNKKLNHRANKNKSQKTFVPTEYVAGLQGVESINHILGLLKKYPLPLNSTLFLAALNILEKTQLIDNVSLKNIRQWRKIRFAGPQIEKELGLWRRSIDDAQITQKHMFLLDVSLPQQRDALGGLYQSCLQEGGKSTAGSYYTPPHIVQNIAKEYLSPSSKALDPCCGTGQFLLAFSDVIKDPANIYGVDCDPLAVRIARINLLNQFRHHNFEPNIFCQDALLNTVNFKQYKHVSSRGPAHDIPDNFHLVATNPPWGARFSVLEVQALKKAYPYIQSCESFSYFISKSFDCLRPEGVASFILPESILNVKSHRDIRFFILKNFDVKKITHLDRVFKNVFTPVVRMDLKKINPLASASTGVSTGASTRSSIGSLAGMSSSKSTLMCLDLNLSSLSEPHKTKADSKHRSNTLVHRSSGQHRVSPQKWLTQKDYIFNIQANKEDYKIIDKIYDLEHTSLKNNAQWALGLVTGNNSQFLTDVKKPGQEPIYRGKDVRAFCFNKPVKYIKFQPQKFQQVAPYARYRAKEKLVYRFISRRLVFAYDNRQSLTLNSANIVIPQIKNYPNKLVMALLNSSAYQFIFQKSFASLKVLRCHLEQLPLPLWPSNVSCQVVNRVDKLMVGRGDFDALDHHIMKLLGLTRGEQEYIRQSVEL